MESEPTTRQNLPPAEVDCRWWKQGYCFRGTACYFRHNPALTGFDRPRYNENQARSVQSDAIQEQCAICLETPDLFGLLVNCDHVFCLDCIRDWRASAKPKNNIDSSDNSSCLKTASKTCPVCRTYSDFVVPSVVFPPALPTVESPADMGKASGSEGSSAKQEIINGYLDRLKRIPCQYFEESVKQQDGSSSFKPICKFGNDCHYAHMHPVTGLPHIFSSIELDTIKMKRRRRAPRSAERAALTAQWMMIRLAALDLDLSDGDDDDDEDGWISD